MRERTVYVGSEDIRDKYGLVYSSFSEKVPEPKVNKVDIPGGSDLDITEAVGFVAYRNGTHELKFLLYSETQEGRLDAMRRLLGDLHGKYLEYSLSWVDGYTFKGRWTVTVEHRFESADLVTMTIDRYPWRFGSESETLDINAHPTGTEWMIGSTYYDDVKITLLQTATVKLGLADSQNLNAGTHTLMETVYGNNPVVVSNMDWWQYLDGRNLVVNTAKGYSLSGEDATFGPDWVEVGTDLYCANEAKQHATVEFTRRDV